MGDLGAGGQRGDGGAYVRAGSERAGAVAIGEHRAAAASEAIEVLGGGDLEALHAAGEGEAIVGFDDELDRVRAHAELDDAEIAARE